MAIEYITGFVTGFEDTVAKHLPRLLKGANIIKVYNGLAHYAYAGNPSKVAGLPFANNSYRVISAFRENSLTFDKMVGRASKKPFRHVGTHRTFRIRFSSENKFVNVQKSLMETAERTVISNCGLKTDRLNPDTEFWHIIRREGTGYFGQLLKKRGAVRLNKGELRPELVSLLCLDLGISRQSVICDPYAGSGAIPIYIQGNYSYRRMYVNDIDEKCYGNLKSSKLGRDPNVIITCADAADLRHIEDGAVDVVISDPPWGFYDRRGDMTEFYVGALTELKRIATAGGRVTLLTGKPDEMDEAAGRVSLIIRSRINILVNGKKACVFTMAKTHDPHD